jgi:hypothetical protein
VRVALFFLSSFAFAQEIPIRPQWKAGDRFEFEHIQSHEEARRPQTRVTSMTPLYLEVVDTSPQGHTVRWRYGKAKQPAEREVPAALIKAEEMLLDLALEARLGPNGDFQKVNNESEIAAKLTEVMKTILATLPPDAVEIPLLKQMLNTQLLLAAATGDMRAFFAIYGVMLNRGEKARVAAVEPFPLQPGRTLTVQRFIGIAREGEKSLDFQSASEYDVKQVEDRMLEWLTTRGMRVQDRSQMPQLFLSENGEYSFDHQRGLVSRALVTKRTTLEPGYDRIERREFRLK